MHVLRRPVEITADSGYILKSDKGPQRAPLRPTSLYPERLLYNKAGIQLICH